MKNIKLKIIAVLTVIFIVAFNFYGCEDVPEGGFDSSASTTDDTEIETSETLKVANDTNTEYREFHPIN